MSATPLREQVAVELHRQGWWCGDCDYEDGGCSKCRGLQLKTADAVLRVVFRWRPRVASTRGLVKRRSCG